MRVPIQFPFSGGYDRSRLSLRSDLGSFYNLLNMKQSGTQFGRLDQCSYFAVGNTLSRGTYYEGGSQTEPSSSAVRMISNSYSMTDYVIEKRDSTQVQVFYQSLTTTGTGLNSGCFLVINNVTALGITLGSSVDVVIDGAATFKWRKNGGAYTTLVGITTAGVPIDGGNATVYFLTASGFTAADTWSWTRTDASYHPGGSSAKVARAAPFMYYKRDLYFINTSNRMMMATGPSGQPYVISVGYRPVYGSYFCFFDDHLVIGGYNTGTITATTKQIIGWSDKTDIHNFIATDTNEADVYTLPGNTYYEELVAHSTNPSLTILGLSVLNQILYVVTNQHIYTTPALGLPIVFSFQESFDMPIGEIRFWETQTPVIDGVNGFYLLAQTAVYFFNGSGFQELSRPVRPSFSISDKAPAPIFNAALAVFDQYRNELLVSSWDKNMYCYQLDYNTWYTRRVDFDSEGFSTKAVFPDVNVVNIGTINRRILSSDDNNSGSPWANQPVYDDNNGTVYTTPKITFHVIGQTLRKIKEITETYLGADVTAVSSTYYSTTTNLQVKLYWYTTNTGLISGSPSTDTNAVWTLANPSGDISYPRLSFRGLALELQILGLVSGKPPGRAIITDFIALVSGFDKEDVTR